MNRMVCPKVFLVVATLTLIGNAVASDNCTTATHHHGAAIARKLGETPAPTPAPAPPSPDVPGTDTLRTFIYRYIDIPMTWHDAEDVCQNGLPVKILQSPFVD